ncbi:hypothetical protein NKDENANG_02817 [Candidatus Entotheonellaceae bacterium PAL068K]
MTPDAFKQQEAATRELIEALRQGMGRHPASPGFATRVMAQADRLPPPSPGFLAGFFRLAGRPLVPRAGLAMVVLLGLALVGAVPQYITWIRAYSLGMPGASIHQARVQETLWHKNFICAGSLNDQSRNYAEIVGEKVRVVAWACPSGDVLVTLEPQKSTDFQAKSTDFQAKRVDTDDGTASHASRRSVWIPMTAPHQQLSWLHGGQEAWAAPRVLRVRKRTALVAVLCQKWRRDRFIKRRIQLANGKCFDEVINPRTGSVVKIKKSSCTPDC